MNDNNQNYIMGKQYEAQVTITDIKESGVITINQDGLIIRVGNEEETILFSSIENFILTLENEVKITLLTGEDIVVSIGNNEILLNALNNGISKMQIKDNSVDNVSQGLPGRGQFKSNGKLIIRLILIICIAILLTKLLSKDTSTEGSDNAGTEKSCNDSSYFYSKARSDLLYRFSRESNVSINKCYVSKDWGEKRITVSCEVTYKGISFPKTERITYSCE